VVPAETAAGVCGAGDCGNWAEFDESIMPAVLGLFSRTGGMPDLHRPVCEFLLRKAPRPSFNSVRR
jgi:hypothetical protein